MSYKYSEYIDTIEECPPSHYQEKACIVYRWVHQGMDHPNDFLPAAIIKPQRVNDRLDHEKKCKAYGLSMYNTLENARKQYLILIAKFPRFAAQVGEYVAEGHLSQSDGQFSSADKRSGHLTFHEYRDTELAKKFTVKGRADGHD